MINRAELLERMASIYFKGNIPKPKEGILICMADMFDENGHVEIGGYRLDLEKIIQYYEKLSNDQEILAVKG